MSAGRPAPRTDDERQRALVRKSLALAPEETRFMPMLNSLLTPAAIHRAAQQGVIVLTTDRDEVAALEIGLALHAAKLRVWVEKISSDANQQTSLANAGVMLLLICLASSQEQEVRRRYGLAMTLGKLIIPVLMQPFLPEDLQFELPLLKWHEDPPAILSHLTRLLSATDIPSSL